MSGPLAVYVHIPFCTVKCGYCDFNAYAGLDSLKTSYRDALLAEIAAWSDVLQGRRVTSISFGGGTPSEVPVRDLAAVIDAIRSRSEVAVDAEVSVEVNPGTLGASAMTELRAAGVDRVSFGVQSFDPTELRLLDRTHSPEAAVAAVSLARDAGFANVSLDLIFGLPGQTVEGWARSLEAALALRPDHVSCYALTIEAGTPFERRVRQGALESPDPDVAAACYELAERELAVAGFRHYEISNWARRHGFESRHNLVYWQDGDYVGIGAGAHGYLAGRRYENEAHPAAYVARAASGAAAPWGSFPPADGATAMFDWLETRLRLVEGFEAAAFEARFGRPLDAVVPTALGRAEAAGLLERKGMRLRLTPAGRLLHSEICVEALLELRGELR
ncbi:MAG: radical SAM family heme chaperone HemW [Dehalococcoidia bacterium]